MWIFSTKTSTIDAAVNVMETDALRLSIFPKLCKIRRDNIGLLSQLRLSCVVCLDLHLEAFWLSLNVHLSHGTVEQNLVRVDSGLEIYSNYPPKSTVCWWNSHMFHFCLTLYGFDL